MKRIAGAMTFALTAALATGALADRTLNYAYGFPPESDADKAAHTYAAAVEEFSGGALKMDVYPMSLLSFLETADGIRDGIADIGWAVPAYAPTLFPSTNMLAELNMQTLFAGRSHSLNLAYAGAMGEYVMLHCDSCQAEYTAHNQLYTGFAASPTYGMQCVAPVTTMDDLKGKRLRVAGAQWARWAAAVGATSVSLPLNEIFEGLSQGVIDCVITSTPELTNMGLVDVVKAIEMNIPGGTFASNAMANVNLDVWNELSEDERLAMLKAAARYSADVTWRYEMADREARETAKNAGIEIVTADPALLEFTKSFAQSDAVDTIGPNYAEKYGLTNSAEMITEFLTVLEKWVGLTASVDSVEQLESIYWDEVYSKLDLAGYGMK